MLFVDGMDGVTRHNPTLQWLYTLTGSPVGPDPPAPGSWSGPEADGALLCPQSRLLVKTSLKLLIVFVEYSETNGPRLITAVNAVDTQRGTHTRTQGHRGTADHAPSAPVQV